MDIKYVSNCEVSLLEDIAKINIDISFIDNSIKYLDLLMDKSDALDSLSSLDELRNKKIDKRDKLIASLNRYLQPELIYS